MINYQLVKQFPTSEPEAVIKTIDGSFVMCIPFDPANTDYKEYLKWVAEGNTPLPAEGTE